MLPPSLRTPYAVQALRLAFCVCGIVGSLLVYGVLQERIMTQVCACHRVLLPARRRACARRGVRQQHAHTRPDARQR